MDYNKITYGQWLRLWLNTYKKPYIKSWKLMKTHIKNHVPDKILNTRLFELNAFDIQNAILKVPTSRMRVEIYDIYHGSLSMAYKLGFIERDISQLLVKPKHVRKIGSALTVEELTEFIRRIKGHRLEPFFKFCLYTGCRRTEALNVSWEDIDFNKKTIHIKGTKTVHSDRYIPLFPEVIELLNLLPCKNGRLFHHRRDYVTKQFKKFCPEHKLHDLRHTFATRCMECTISINVVQLWLGHTRLETTSRIYTHVQPDFIKSESAKFRLV